MSLSLGLTKGFDILSFMTDLFETTTSIRKLSKKYGVDSKILHNWMNILCSKDFRRKRSSEVKRQENFRRAYKPTYAGPRLYNALEVNFGRTSYETVPAGKREYMPSMFQ